MTQSKREQQGVAIAASGDGQMALEGIFVAGGDESDRGAVIAPPHPLYGGSMDSPVVSELAFAFQKCDIASLAFNWRGVGASGGTPSGEISDAVADYGAVLTHLAETVGGAVTACGYSFGAATAASAIGGRPRVDRVVLVAPPPSMLDAAALASFSGPMLIIVGEDDAFAPLADVKALAASLDHTQLVTVPDADHFFMSGLAEVGRATADWITRTG
jgi:alpha/beta superfamily hydrolase